MSGQNIELKSVFNKDGNYLGYYHLIPSDHLILAGSSPCCIDPLVYDGSGNLIGILNQNYVQGPNNLQPGMKDVGVVVNNEEESDNSNTKHPKLCKGLENMVRLGNTIKPGVVALGLCTTVFYAIVTAIKG
ncbi:uncharacterized protein SPAPADRAFT_60939 [Spathaspora passalidarum NRRL Y-27907]|uniref:Uncharacterized protein n=1 Tax=Spathaspora passalidarum (strain NRRL Y-27907 / 11-Y1) TaxID=619300 RepID=G3AKJ9_SPAPN|nr:uncharacterized protein SPAPADRAFT_60939 [Spathaspora passalidarum NRRL Y-27907]EGW33603.1 hypothetical protein SPAPADRAFT_60939 [Spathaspora passalidarum NRRL Y-27907]